MASTTLSPMLSCPLKQTLEINWVTPLKGYIASTYGDDPERYSEECSMLNRLRQDIRGVGVDSAAGRDLLYRYYGQLELLDLRFPVDEHHIKISFTWLDAFTQKATAQFSLAYEKASIIFNISAVLSCHGSKQDRHEELGLKTAYHSFQAAAGMFSYINDNFLHAPSTDLSRDTVKTLIAIMLAQAQEVFLEKQINDGKKAGLIAKLANQAAFLYDSAVDGSIINVTNGVFEKPWLQLLQTKSNLLHSLTQFHQAKADNDSKAYGTALSRLQKAETLAREAIKISTMNATAFATSTTIPPETAASIAEILQRHLSTTQELLTSYTRDNDFIYHQAIPSETSLPPIAKLPAAKAIPVGELYQGQDIQRIIGADIFQRIIPLAVTESASLYDEEKAKMVRSMAEIVSQASDEMTACLDYLKLPTSLMLLSNQSNQSLSVDSAFRDWVVHVAQANDQSRDFDWIKTRKSAVIKQLELCTVKLDMEEDVCEKMRTKYGDHWTQDPSRLLTAALRTDISNYRSAMEEASHSDNQLIATSLRYREDFDNIRKAHKSNQISSFYVSELGQFATESDASHQRNQKSLIDEDLDEGADSLSAKIAYVEDLLQKLNLIKQDRFAILKAMKDKVLTDDISNVLILNKKTMADQESKLFEIELEKYHSYQTRILQANHRQAQLLKDLTKSYGDLLQDSRIRAQQSRIEEENGKKSAVMAKFKKLYHAHIDLEQGLSRATKFYLELSSTVQSLSASVEQFVENRRREGAELLKWLEATANSVNSSRNLQEQQRLQQLMRTISLDDSGSHLRQSANNGP